MAFERIKEALFFWRTHLLSLAIIVIPFSFLTTGGELLFGQAVELSGTDANPEFQFNPSAMLWAFFMPVVMEAVLIPQLAAIQAEKPRTLGQCTLIGLNFLPALMLTNILMVLTFTPAILLLTLTPTGSAAAVLALVGMAALFISLWIFLRLSLAPFMVVLEQLNPMDAIRESLNRTTTIQRELIGAWLLTVLAVLSITNIIGGIFIQLAGDHAGSRLVLGILVALGAALLHVLLFRFYGLVSPNEKN